MRACDVFIPGLAPNTSLPLPALPARNLATDVAVEALVVFANSGLHDFDRHALAFGLDGWPEHWSFLADDADGDFLWPALIGRGRDAWC